MEEKIVLSYFTFLLIFIGLPLAVVTILYRRKYQEGEENQKTMIKRILIALTILIVVAITYTTPWDNFLVENAIWYYENSKIIGILIGFVPIEEYAFFVFQTLLIGLIFGWIQLQKTNKDNHYDLKQNLRLISSLSFFIIWLVSFIIFINKIESLTYLNLILLWGIPPIIIQLIYGADILWLSRRDLISVISVSTIYLAVVDAIAIGEGVWTININTSTGILLAGMLPIEEFLFFLVTNILITFGLILMIDSRSIDRFNGFYTRIKEILLRTRMER
ncbi:MAG: lycopene cyclase domain-containing protein [Promethearchaeota archaeon]